MSVGGDNKKAFLDPAFYTSYYDDLGKLSSRQAHLHWKRHGEAEGRHPNSTTALERLLADPRLPTGFDLEVFRDEAGRSSPVHWDFQVVQYVLDSGRFDTGSASEVGASSAAEGVASLGSRLHELPATFNVATYLARNEDVRAVLPDAAAAVLHFLDYGRRENRSFLPERIDDAFIAHLYGVTVPGSMSKDQVAAFIRRMCDLSMTDLVFLSEVELFWYHGVRNEQVLHGFDPDYYLLLAKPEAGFEMNRFDALVHFCEVGQFDAFDVSSALAFDADFYAFEYGNAGTLSSGVTAGEKRKMFREWLASAGPDARSPNLRLWAHRTFDIVLSPLIERQVRCWGKQASPVEGESRSTLLLRPLIEGELGTVLSLEVSDGADAECLASVADHLAVAGKVEAADAAYAHVLLSQPGHGRSLRHRADQAQRARLFGVAVALREQIIRLRRADIWNYITLADCYQALGMEDKAADALLMGTEAFPGDVALRHRAREAAASAFDELWTRSTAFAMQLGIPAAQGKIKEALARCTSRAEPSLSRRSIKRIAIYANVDLPQCRFYRVEQKIEQLEAAGYAVQTFEYASGTADYLARLDEIDLTIVYRVPAFPYVIDALQKTSGFGIPTIYDIDDLVFDSEEFPPDFASYDGQISEAHYASMACGVPLFAHAMSLCDCAIASTEVLREPMAARVRNGIAYHHPNALSALHERYAREPAQKSADRVTIFYGSATKAHKADFRDIVEPALASVFDQHGDRVRVLLVGSIGLSPLLDPWKSSIDVVEPMSRIEDYWDLLKTADINLAVLSRSTFNDCKSEIKWLEAAMMGIPSVVSRSATYEHVIDDGRTGLLCDDSRDFSQALLQLVEDADLRDTVGRAARDAVLARYSKQAMAANLRDIFADVESRMPPPRPRVLIVNVFYPPQAIGGATRVVHDNVRDLKANYGDEFEVSVLCTLEGGTKPYDIEWYSLEGVRVARIATPDRPDVDKVLEDPLMAAAFARCLDRIEPDLVHFHCIQRLTASVVDVVRHRGLPYLVTMHDGWWVSPNQFILGASGRAAFYDFRSSPDDRSGVAHLPDRARVLRRLLQSATCLTAVSPQFAQICRDTGIGNVIAIENGLSAVPAARRSRNDGRVRLGHLGGTEVHKGLPLLRAVLQTTPYDNLSLTVVDLALDPGASRSEVWGTTPVTIRAKAPRDEMPDLYGSIDVLVAPSMWPESFGLVTREAVAAGCWVIASDRGAIGGCVSDGLNGFVIQVEDPSGLRQALASIDADPERFSQPPDHVVPIRPAAAQADDLARLYKELLARPRGAATN